MRITVEQGEPLIVCTSCSIIKPNYIVLEPDERTLDKYVNRAILRQLTANRIDVLERNDQIQITLSKIRELQSTEQRRAMIHLVLMPLVLEVFTYNIFIDMMKSNTVWQRMIALFLTKWIHLRETDPDYSQIYDVAISITLQVMVKVPESGRFVEVPQTNIICQPYSKL
jgi:hypothetical protein